MNKKVLVLTGLLLVLVFIGVLHKKQFSLLGNCEENVIQRASSENHEIQISVVNCGATTDYATHVAVKDNAALNKIVVIKGDHSNDLKLTWLSSNKASIEYLGSLEDAFNFKSNLDNLNFELSPIIETPVVNTNYQDPQLKE